MFVNLNANLNHGNAAGEPGAGTDSPSLLDAYYALSNDASAVRSPSCKARKGDDRSPARSRYLPLSWTVALSGNSRDDGPAQTL